MTAGTITWDSGAEEYVSGATCDAVRASLSYTYFPMFTAKSCSTDPVAAGTSLVMQASGGSTFTLNVSAITATSPVTSTSSTFDSSTASGVWGLAFTSVVGVYLLGIKVGALLRLMRGRG